MERSWQDNVWIYIVVSLFITAISSYILPRLFSGTTASSGAPSPTIEKRNVMIGKADKGTPLTVTAAVSPSVILPKNMVIPCATCSSGYSLGVVLNHIQIDALLQQTTLYFTVTNTTGSACSNNSLYNIELKDTASGQSAIGKGTTEQGWSLGQGQSIPGVSIFSFIPHSGSTYTLRIPAMVCGTYENYQTEVLHF